ncbi:two-component system, chemotaxis family, response regulator CheY [Andreprevotia lacus DSM 23236]|jgi:two-component system chemotaxis response regulator CheY|uniref:Two-component system, chemotaxis family, response regulator CheY n=1 Tax=Andreprevotia lacus DSM 23236 TaxID=1121001 RepID=A0A1W1Y1P6_9NEIS|nr:response regulator [Andreprevotia lacus]SMC29721.1 two-component system, chemotaxis family, response regulator CheY [Andreprevotia lacus DSM 23236]
MIELKYLNVCLVEPSIVQAQFIKQELTQLGVTRIEVVGSGADALARIAAGPQLDVLLSALYLPDMTGTELVYQLRTGEVQNDLGFILISSETKPHVLDPVRQAGSLAILPKPFTRNQLQVALNNALSYLNADVERDDFDALHVEDLKVLLVDDSGTARRHVRSILEKLGFEHFTEAVNGREAIALLGESLFDLVVTDYNMPDVDGRELTSYIRQHSAQSMVPVLMVSSEKNEERLAAVHEAGVSAICDKPFDTTSVKQMLAQMLSN